MILALLPQQADARRGHRGGTHTSVNVNSRHRTNVNVNTRKNVNVNTHKNVNVDVNVNRRYGCCHGGYHPVATAAAVVATAVIVGSIVNTLPPSCTTVITAGISYSQCGNTWYQPQYSGSNVTYVVVNAP